MLNTVIPLGFIYFFVCEIGDAQILKGDLREEFFERNILNIDAEC